MITYTLDALRYREGAISAVWLTLGLTNMSMLISGAAFGGQNPIIFAMLVSMSSGFLLFLTGEWLLSICCCWLPKVYGGLDTWFHHG